MSASEDPAQVICRAIARCGTLMYADKQALKAGEHRAVLDRLSVRYRIQVVVFYGFVANVLWLYWQENTDLVHPFVAFWAAVAIAGGVWFHHLWRQFAQARKLIDEYSSRIGVESTDLPTDPHR